ncbi:hypothetical protein GCM10010502_44990 [Kitasatospora aureofaciens]|uniref:Uncharacterized protein n=1 Tax=Kitasatospora aureofaciens TaxID=1894 RepID=A0A8H9HV00_KITAU|nr:hypothetical protein GCM10010502_44990 [Kitasatospora aureofaciens]
MGGEDVHQAAEVDLGGAQVLGGGGLGRGTFRHGSPVCQCDNLPTISFSASARTAEMTDSGQLRIDRSPTIEGNATRLVEFVHGAGEG